MNVNSLVVNAAYIRCEYVRNSWLICRRMTLAYAYELVMLWNVYEYS